MKIILFGSEGTIGSYVKSELLKNHYDLYLVENKTRIKRSIRYKILKKNFLTKKKFFSEKDIVIYLPWGNLDNFNSKLHIKKEFPEHFANIKKLLKLGMKNILVSGTCFEYKKKNGIMSETSKISPATNYGIAKDRLRIKLNMLKKIYKFKLSWIRIFYIYGNKNDNNNLWSQLNNCAKNKKNKNFNMSSGEQYRDYIHVKDLAKNIVAIALKKRNFGVINVCSGKPVQIKKLVKKWKIKYKLKINLKFNRLSIPNYESIKFWGSDKKLKKILN